jgi:hypothetical protein
MPRTLIGVSAGQPQQHLARRLVRERDGEHRQRRRLAGREQPRDARREHARLAAAGAREDERRPVRQRDGLELRRVEVGEKRCGHRRQNGDYRRAAML